MKRSEFLASLAAIVASPSLLIKKKKAPANPTLGTALKLSGFPEVKGIKTVHFKDYSIVQVNGQRFKVTKHAGK